MTPNGLEQLKRHEGLRLKAYRCPAGVWTIGYGHTAGVKPGDVITDDEAERLLMADAAKAELDARALVPNFDSLTPRRQDALVNMAFNLGRGNAAKGTGLAGFKTFLRCVKAGQWMAAGTSLETTKWYSQVRNRAREIVQMILQG